MFVRRQFAAPSAPAFNPLSLAWSLYQIDYAALPWVGTASAGSSGTHNGIAGVAPGVGANFGTHPSADGNGSSTAVNLPTFGDLLTVSAYTMHMDLEADVLSAPVAPGSEYTDRLIIGDTSNGELYVRINTSGAAAGHYDGTAYRDTPYVAIGTGAKRCLQVKFGSGFLKMRASGGAWSTPVASGNLRAGALGNTLALFLGYGSGRFDGRIGRFAIAPSEVADADLDKMYVDSQTNFAVL